MALNDKLVKLLADGAWHSGEDLAESLGISRMAVWKQLQKFPMEGLEVESARGRGYRIPGGVEFLDEGAIKRAVSGECLKQISRLVVLPVVDSTNTFVASLGDGGHGAVSFAEKQTGGRGRRGREWLSPYGRNIYMSMGWRFQGGAASLEGLSLVIGLAVHRALGGCSQLRLKWPNDLLFEGRKVAGILVEMTGDPVGECQAIIGIGINVGMAGSETALIDQPWADAREFCGFSRNQIASSLLEALIVTVNRFAAEGFSPFREQWQRLDAYSGRPVKLSMPGDGVEGIARGVADNGALLLEVGGEIRSFSGGEVSVRPGGPDT